VLTTPPTHVLICTERAGQSERGRENKRKVGEGYRAEGTVERERERVREEECTVEIVHN
jgi:hypothetical protein